MNILIGILQVFRAIGFAITLIGLVWLIVLAAYIFEPKEHGYAGTEDQQSLPALRL